MSIFNLDIELLTKRLLPTRKRGITHIEWLASCLSGISFIYNQFTIFRNQTLKELSYNSQTKILEKALNDNYDDNQRRIYIDNTFDNKEVIYLFNKGEADPIYIYDISEGKKPVYWYSVEEFANDFDFVVYVPIGLTSIQDKIAALTTFYKLASTRFKIILY